jgi:putative ABC transport system permease protein
VSDEAGEIFSPLGRLAKDLNSRAVHPGLFVVGRLKRGVTLDQARADVDRIATSLARSYPATNRDIRSRTDFYAKRAAESSRTLLVALWGAVTAVLLVACASAAALLGARGAARAREFAIRIALGATRVHLLRQLLTESVLLALASGAGGLLLAWRALPAIAARLPTTIPRTADIGIDGGVLAFATALTLATGLIAGVIPAWQAGRSALPRTAGSRIEARASNRRARGLLVVGQLALSQVLLIGAGLLLATLAHLLRVDPGFRSDHLATALYYLPDAVYVTHDRVVGFHEAALARTAALPGVSGSGLVSPPPFGFGSSSADVTVDNDLEPIKTDTFVVSPDALTVLGVPLRSGRFFDTRDRQGAPRVALVDDWFASRYLGPHPLGRRIRLDRSAPAEVVGIVGHIAERSLDYEGRPQVYSPFFAESRHFAQIVVRTPDTDPMARMADIRKAVSALDPDLPLFGAASMDALIAATADSARLGAAVFGAFAATAWLLAAIGLAGVVGYSVTTRTREIGIRLALGARPGGLVRDVVGYGGGLTLAGLALGIAAGMVCARTMSALLVGVAPADPSVIVLSAIALLVTGIAASYLPARRISRVDPVDALRSE